MPSIAANPVTGTGESPLRAAQHRFTATTIAATTLSCALEDQPTDAAAVNAAVDQVVADLVTHSETSAVIDSDELARVLLDHRQDRTDRVSDPKQVTDYLKHLLRNTSHVCRHQVAQGMYRVHVDDECSSTCDRRWEQAARSKTSSVFGAQCPDCFMARSANGTCGCD